QGAPPEKTLRDSFTLADLGVKLRTLDELRSISVESDSALINDALAQSAISAATAGGVTAKPVFTYLANSIRSGGKEIPYSLVTAMDIGEPASPDQPIVLNDWAAADLGAKPGDTVTLDYYVWKEEGRLVTESAKFRLARIVPLKGSFADRDLAPEYPGM